MLSTCFRWSCKLLTVSYKSTEIVVFYPIWNVPMWIDHLTFENSIFGNRHSASSDIDSCTHKDDFPLLRLTMGVTAFL